MDIKCNKMAFLFDIFYLKSLLKISEIAPAIDRDAIIMILD